MSYLKIVNTALRVVQYLTAAIFKSPIEVGCTVYE